MSSRLSCLSRLAPWVPGGRHGFMLGLLALATGVAPGVQANEPVTPAQRATARQVASQGVPLSALADNAPASHTVQRGDTLWAISSLFLKSPWRWPELWGMNLQDIRNPHLIYPGQVLVLEKDGDRARLRLARGAADGQMPSNTVKLSPRVRSQLLDNGAISAIPLQLIAPFLNEAVVLNQDELAAAPRIVATQEGRVMISRGETAYVRGDLGGARSFSLFRQSKPLLDPLSKEVLGYEAGFIGTADFVRAEGTGAGTEKLPVPATFVMTSARQEAGVGDRLMPVPARDFSAYVPHPPASPIDGRVISVYGEALTAGQNQIVAINRGLRDGIERGHVLALWRAGAAGTDRTGDKPQAMQLPDERTGLVFRVPGLRPGVVRADPVGVRPDLRRRPLQQPLIPTLAEAPAALPPRGAEPGQRRSSEPSLPSEGSGCKARRGLQGPPAARQSRFRRGRLAPRPLRCD